MIKERSELLEAVARDKVYPLELFKRATGLSAWALRSARRAGLKMKTVGRNKFVRGEDWHQYIEGIES